MEAAPAAHEPCSLVNRVQALGADVIAQPLVDPAGWTSPGLSIYPSDEDEDEDIYHSAALRDAECPRWPPAFRSRRHPVPPDAVLGKVVDAPRLDTFRLEKMMRSGPADLPKLPFSPQELARELRCLRDAESFNEHILLPPAERAGTARRTPSSVPPAVLSQIVPSLASALDPRSVPTTAIYAPLYLVPKRGEQRHLYRVIFAACQLNARCRPPPRAPIPHLHRLITHLMSARYAIRCDFRSWFYQFRLARTVARSYFLWRTHAQVYTFDRMAMGWSHAVYIACASAHALLALAFGPGSDPPLAVWVDDGVLWGTEAEALRRQWAAVLNLLHQYNAELKEWAGPASEFEIVGLGFDLNHARWRLSPTWVERFRESFTTLTDNRAPISLRAWWSLVGSAVWAAYALWLPYAPLQPAFTDLLSALRDVDLDSPPPDILFSPSTRAVEALRAVAAVCHAWRTLPSPRGSPFYIATDASTVGAGVVWDGRTFSWPWRVGPLSAADLQACELTVASASIALLAGSPEAPPSGTQLVLLVDNLGTAWRLSKWSTAGAQSPLVTQLWNTLVRQSWTLRVGWIPTDRMPADEPSRRGQWSDTASRAELRGLAKTAYYPPLPLAPSTLHLPQTDTGAGAA